MVNSCIANAKPGSRISFHAFPHKNSELLQKLIQAVKIMDLSNIQTWFPHPQIPNAKVHVIFDVCHMTELMQKLLGDQKVICYEENGTIQRIKCQYTEALNSVEEDLGLSLANRLKKQHILWTKYKKNVKIAAQTLSSSLASAIDFL